VKVFAGSFGPLFAIGEGSLCYLLRAELEGCPASRSRQSRLL